MVASWEIIRLEPRERATASESLKEWQAVDMIQRSHNHIPLWIPEGESMGCIDLGFSWSNGAFWVHDGSNPQLDSWKIPLDWDEIWLRLLSSRLT